MADKKEEPKKLERIYIVPLRKAYDYIRTKRTPRAVKMLRQFIARNFKVDINNVSISEGVNSFLWRDSIQKPPRKIKVSGVLENSYVKVWLVGEQDELKKKGEEQQKVSDAKKESQKKKDETKQKKETEAQKKNEDKAKAQATAPKKEAEKKAPVQEKK